MTITLSQTVTAIVERSGQVIVPFRGTLTLVPGEDGRFRLTVRTEDGERGLIPRASDGRKLPAGHVLTPAEAERAVRTLLGIK